MKKILFVIISSFTLSFNASAIDWYVGASLGNSTFDSSGTLSELTSFDNKDTSFSLTWGLPIEEYFNVEFSYSNFGDVDYAFRQIGAETVSFSQSPTSISTSAAFNYPISDRYKFIARAGYEKWDVEYNNNGGTFFPRSTETSGYSPFYGLGISYALSNIIHVKGEVQHHDFDLGDNELTFQNYTIGLRYFY